MEAVRCPATKAMRLVPILLLGGVAIGVACDGESSAKVPMLCATDADCGSGRGCLTVSASEKYCAPLCQSGAGCPNKMECPLYDLLLSSQAPTCVESGAHEGGAGVCQLYEGNYGPTSCPSANPTDFWGWAGGAGGRGGSGGSFGGSGGRSGTGGSSSNTSRSCKLTNCSKDGFTYSCASSSSQSSSQYRYDGSGNLVGWNTTVTYGNGSSVTCQATGSSGSCSGSGDAQCSW